MGGEGTRQVLHTDFASSMNFTYQAKSRSGERATGAIEAESPGEARSQLREKGLFVLSLHEAPIAALPRPAQWRLPRRGVGKNDVLMVTYQLAIMLQSGVDLGEALRGLAEHCSHPALKRLLETVHADVAAGQPMSEALRRHAQIFGEAYLASIAAAEASGTMPDVLKRLAELTQNEIRLRSTIISVLTYPAILLSVAMAVAVALVGFVLPQFATVFADLGTTPPPLTRVLIGGASWLRQNLISVAVALAAVAAIAWHVYASGRLRKLIDRMLLTWPVISGAAQSLFAGRAFRLMGTMLDSGIPLLDAIKLCRLAVPNQLYHRLFDLLEQEVLNGRGIADTLTRTPFIPPGATQMVATAERTGKLGQVLQTVGAFYEEDGERQARQLAKLLEPAVIISMGGVVSIVVAAIMLPLLDMTTLPR
jgi:type II secretory pathway component PulF